ncbi:MAG: diacylglycerol kinase family lipid kinase [Chloroflexota bacterium]|nr:diacylglycerol kinase family lipid kinase [Chloroflexota bacterium]
MNTTKIIVNPYAGRWKAQAAISDIERACQKIGMNYELVVTDGPNHGIELAQEAALAGFSPIVAAGGDGSISEVVNGLMQATGAWAEHSRSDKVIGPLGIIPLGSADDFADMLGLEKEIEAACRVVLAGHTRTIDLGCVNGRYFDNNSAIGLEPMVTITERAMKRVKGTPRYILAALKTILRHKPWHMRLAWEDGEYEGMITLVSVGNTRRTGGAFWMTPRAEMDDGYLDFVFAGGVGRLKVLRLLPKTFDGSHVEDPQVQYARTTSLTIECDPPTPIQADGELFDLSATRIKYTILPDRLRVIVPAPGRNTDSRTATD